MTAVGTSGRVRSRRDLALLVGGAAVSTAGSSASLVAVLLHVRPLGPAWVAASLAALLVPVVVLAPLAGLLVDRLPNRRLLAGALAVAAAATLAAVPGVAPGREVLLLLGLLVVGAAAAVVTPAVAALLPVVSGEDLATRAYGYHSALSSGGLLAGAALAGVLVELVGTRGVLVLDAASFAAMALAVTRLRAERRSGGVEGDVAPGRPASGPAVDPPAGDGTARPGERRRAPRRRTRGEAWQGFAVLRDDPLLRVVVGGVAAVVLVSIVVNVAEVYVLVEDLGLSPAGYGLVTACWPLAAVAGGWAAGRLSGERALVAGLAVGGVAMGAALAVAGLLLSVPVVALAWLVAGAGNAVQVVCLNAIVRGRTADAHRGRAFAATGAALQAANVSGLAISAGVVAVLGASESLVVAGAATAAVAGATFLQATRVAAGNRPSPSVAP